jgi:hypothetical protein
LFFYSDSWLKKTEYYKKNKFILDQERGGGFWCWKPYVIYETLNKLNNNDQPKLNNKRLEGQESLIKASIDLKSSLDSKFAYLESDQIVTTYERNSLTLILKDGMLIYFTIDEPISSRRER